MRAIYLRHRRRFGHVDVDYIRARVDHWTARNAADNCGMFASDEPGRDQPDPAACDCAECTASPTYANYSAAMNAAERHRKFTFANHSWGWWHRFTHEASTPPSNRSGE
jgi:hypothetical protein